MPCIFCGTAKTTREHVPRQGWLKELMADLEGEVFGHRALHNVRGRPSSEGRLATWVTPKPESVIKCACKQCNEGWMNHLDHSAERWATAMAMGYAVRFSSLQAHATVSAWACKVALCFASGVRGLEVDAEDGNWLRRHLMPPAGYEVWLAAADPDEDNPGFVLQQTMDLKAAARRVKPGFVTTIRVGAAIWQVLAAPTKGFDRGRIPGWGRYAQQIWPAIERVSWPQRPYVTDRDFLAFAASFVRGTPEPPEP